MRTVIRLQNHGCKNHPYWWVVVMGSFKNPKGRFIEKIGLWIPRKGKTVQRAVVLNKPRIKYWLAHGAMPSKTVQRMFSYADIMPRPYTKFGMKNYYEKPEKGAGLNKDDYEELKKLGIFRSQYARYKDEQEENLTIRSLKTMNEVQKQMRNVETPEEALIREDIPENLKDRTREFYQLQKQLDEIESDVKRLHTTKREVLFRRLNKLAQEGIVSKDTFQNDKNLKDSEEYIKSKLQSAPFQRKMMEREQKLKEWIELLKPTNPQEYKELLSNNTKKSAAEIDKEAQDLFAQVGDKDSTLTRADIIDYSQKEVYKQYRTIDSLDKYIQTIKQNPEKVLIPSTTPVNPQPNFNTYDPNYYYDLRPSYSELPNPNKYYDSYPAPADTRRKPNRNSYTPKQNKGRKTQYRVFFSTVNTRAAPSLTTSIMPVVSVFTGLMRKIGRF